MMTPKKKQVKVLKKSLRSPPRASYGEKTDDSHADHL